MAYMSILKVKARQETQKFNYIMSVMSLFTTLCNFPVRNAVRNATNTTASCSKQTQAVWK